MKLKYLKIGDYFTIKPLENPKESEVYIRGEYDRTDKKYCCVKFSDISVSRLFDGNKEVYTDFIFLRFLIMKKKLLRNCSSVLSIILSIANRCQDLDIKDEILISELDILISLISDSRRIINGNSEV